MEKEIQMEVVFNQEHKTRSAETEAEPCDHLFSYLEIKHGFQKTMISYNFNNFSTDELSLVAA